MIFAGIDIGSLTAKAVLLRHGKVIASHFEPVKATSLASADHVMGQVLEQAGLRIGEIQLTCSTGYGRLEIPFADCNRSEVSCHGLGTFFSNKSVRTIIDIGGQDCKVVVIDSHGMVEDFVMNDKCAAGTGRSLEILARTLGVELADLGRFALRSHRPLPVSNKCSIFMELDVMQLLYQGKRRENIAHGITVSIARRIASLTGKVTLQKGICISGGVSKNAAVVRDIEQALGVTFTPLAHDPQLMGALGAACFAEKEYRRRMEGGRS
ncbi:MAG: 2-hydroxyglutaryl-CoA dehydratase [Deltaproteobacteria bacterium HGW-Deltaproteobacteria-22]|nr:MAG: 2-hydroxyglutaryl-CoA dehydratase [Deltaproteobacteria bacterium HGW-Deltaproteobacteria-22]